MKHHFLLIAKRATRKWKEKQSGLSQNLIRSPHTFFFLFFGVCFTVTQRPFPSPTFFFKFLTVTRKYSKRQQEKSRVNIKSGTYHSLDGIQVIRATMKNIEKKFKEQRQTELILRKMKRKRQMRKKGYVEGRKRTNEIAFSRKMNRLGKRELREIYLFSRWGDARNKTRITRKRYENSKLAGVEALYAASSPLRCSYFTCSRRRRQ